ARTTGFVVEPASQPIRRREAAQIGNGLDVPDDDAGWHGSDPDTTVASVLAAIETRERVRAVFEAHQDVLLIAQLSRAHPVRQRRNRGFPAVHVIQDHEALGTGALDKEMPFDPRSGRPWVPGGDRGG